MQNIDVYALFGRGAWTEKSNFVRPTSLSGRERFTFIEGGRTGKAFSDEAEDVQSIALLDDFSQMLKGLEYPESNSGFLLSLSRSLGEVVEKTKYIGLRENYAKMMEQYELPKHELGKSLVRISVFLFLTNISWSIGYEVVEPKET